MRAWEDSAVTFARGAGPTTWVGRAFLLCGCCTGDARLLPRGPTFQRNRLSPGAPAWTARGTFTAGLDDTHGLDLSAPDVARRGLQTPDPGCGTGTRLPSQLVGSVRVCLVNGLDALPPCPVLCPVTACAQQPPSIHPPTDIFPISRAGPRNRETPWPLLRSPPPSGRLPTGWEQGHC